MKRFYFIFTIILNLIFSLHGMSDIPSNLDKNLQKLVGDYFLEMEIMKFEREGERFRSDLNLELDLILIILEDLREKSLKTKKSEELAEIGRQRVNLSRKLSNLKGQIRQEYFQLQAKLEQMLPIELIKEYEDFKPSRDSGFVEKRTNVWFFLTDRHRYENSALCKLARESHSNREIYKILYGRYPFDLRGLSKKDKITEFSNPSEHVVPCAKCRLVPKNFDATFAMPSMLVARYDDELVRSKKDQSKTVSKHKKKKEQKGKSKQHVEKSKKSTSAIPSSQPVPQVQEKQLDPVDYASELIKRVQNPKATIIYVEPLLQELEVFAQKSLPLAQEFLGIFYSENHEYSDGRIEKDQRKAIQILENYVKRNTDSANPNVIFKLAQLFSEDASATLHFVSLALKRNFVPKNKEINFLAELYFKTRMFSESIQWVERTYNKDLIWWYKGRCALACGDMRSAVKFFEYVFPLCKNAKYLSKQELTDFDGVINFLLDKKEIPCVNAILVRIELAVGLSDPISSKIQTLSGQMRQLLIEHLVIIPETQRDLAVNFMHAYIFAHGICVEKIDLKALMSVASIILSDGSFQDKILILEERPDLVELLEFITKSFVDDFVHLFLQENLECEVKNNRTTAFNLLVCHVLSAFFASHRLPEKAALFFMTTEYYLTRLFRQDTTCSVGGNDLHMKALEGIQALVEKQNIYALAALSFSSSLRFVNRITPIADCECLIEKFFKLVPCFIDSARDVDIIKCSVLGMACNLSGNYFYTKKQDVPSAIKCLELGLKLCPNSELIKYNLGSAILSENMKDAKRGRDLLLKICENNADAAYMLGCFYDPNFHGVGGDLAQKSKNMEIALGYYKKAALNGQRRAAALLAAYIAKKSCFAVGDKDDLERYVNLAGDMLESAQKKYFYSVIQSLKEQAQIETIVLNLKERAIILLQIDSKKNFDLIGMCKLFMEFLDVLETKILLGSENNRIENFFHYLGIFGDYISSNSDKLDKNLVRMCNLFLNRIDERLLASDFLIKILSLTDEQKSYKALLISQLILACERQSKPEYKKELQEIYTKMQ